MSISTTFSNVLIEGNTIDGGFASSGGSTITPYTYTTLISSNADCKILNNNFSGITSNASTNKMLDLTNNTSIITNNIFVRGSNNLSSYINFSGGFENIITNNIFDKSTTDGANASLVSGISQVNSIYERNKNQIGYAIIPIADENISMWGNNGLPIIGSPNVAADSSTFPNLWGSSTGITAAGLALYSGTGEHLNFTANGNSITGSFFKNFNLNKYLPSSCQILDIKFTMYWNSTGTFNVPTSNTNFFNMELYTTKNHTDILDLKNNQPGFLVPATTVNNSFYSLFPINNSTTVLNTKNVNNNIELNLLNYTGTARINTISTSLTNANISQYATLTDDQSINLLLNFNWEKDSSSDDLSFTVSSIVVKYIY